MMIRQLQIWEKSGGCKSFLGYVGDQTIRVLLPPEELPELE